MESTDSAYAAGQVTARLIIIALGIFFTYRGVKLAKYKDRTPSQTVRMVLCFIVAAFMGLAIIGQIARVVAQ